MHIKSDNVWKIDDLHQYSSIIWKKTTLIISKYKAKTYTSSTKKFDDKMLQSYSYGLVTSQV